ncbi:MAG: hypothetical protein ACFFD4_33315 [Candidatus Odinarchaeota archaeon]
MQKTKRMLLGIILLAVTLASMQMITSVTADWDEYWAPTDNDNELCWNHSRNHGYGYITIDRITDNSLWQNLPSDYSPYPNEYAHSSTYLTPFSDDQVSFVCIAQGDSITYVRATIWLKKPSSGTWTKVDSNGGTGDLWEVADYSPTKVELRQHGDHLGGGWWNVDVKMEIYWSNWFIGSKKDQCDLRMKLYLGESQSPTTGDYRPGSNWYGGAIPSKNYNFAVENPSYGGLPGARVDTIGYSDYGFNFFGIAGGSPFTFSSTGELHYSGYFYQYDTFPSSLWPGRRNLKLYVLSEDGTIIYESHEILGSNDGTSWKFKSGYIQTGCAGFTVRLALGRYDGWLTDWKLTARWSNVLFSNSDT